MTFSPERRAAAYVTTPQQAKDIPRIVAQKGLHDRFDIQYVRWIRQIASGNLGYSTVASRPVMEAFWYLVPFTIELNLYALPLIILFGIWLGTQSGIHQNRLFDHVSRVLAIIGWSLPTFLFALILLMILYGRFSLFPIGVISDDVLMYVSNPDNHFIRYTHLYTIDGLLNGLPNITLDALHHLCMPVLTQVIVIVAILMRVMRSGMVEELSRDYVITARAKGADEKTITIKHARRNALIPVVTVAGQLVAFAMEGSIAVEVVFRRQGIGGWLAESATQLDMPVIMAITLFMGLVFVVTNLIIDIIYAYIDPRIRLT